MKKWTVIVIWVVIVIVLIWAIVAALFIDRFGPNEQLNSSENPYIGTEPYNPVEELYEDLCATDDTSCYQWEIDLQTSDPNQTLPDGDREQYPIINWGL